MNMATPGACKYIVALSILGFSQAWGAEIDASTLFHLTLNGAVVTSDGEGPLAQNGVAFAPGVVGLGGVFGNASVLTYAAPGNINALEGTLEFFVRPSLNGNDSASHTFLVWGDAGGMVFLKDSANNLRGIWNRFGENGTLEIEVPAVDVSDWSSGQSQYLAYTWNSSTSSVKLYINGVLASSDNFAGSLPAIPDTTFSLGLEGSGNPLEGLLDEVRISSVERTSDEILERYQSLTAVPEPGTAGLVIAAGALGWAAFKRRLHRSLQ